MCDRAQVMCFGVLGAAETGGSAMFLVCRPACDKQCTAQFQGFKFRLIVPMLGTLKPQPWCQ